MPIIDNMRRSAAMSKAAIAPSNTKAKDNVPLLAEEESESWSSSIWSAMPIIDNMRRPGAKAATASNTKDVPLLAEELDRKYSDYIETLDEEHSQQLAELQQELLAAKNEIESLRAISDERTDSLSPLPDPDSSITRRFVTKSGRAKRPPKNAAMRERSALSIAADMKVKHDRELQRVTEEYAAKVKSLEKTARRHRDSLRKSKGGIGSNAAFDDKENSENEQDAEMKKLRDERDELKRLVSKLRHEKRDEERLRWDFRLNRRSEEYERLFADDFIITAQSDLVKKSLNAFEDAERQAASVKDARTVCLEMQEFIANTRSKLI